MSTNSYLPPYQRVLHLSGLKVLLLVQFVVVLPFFSYMPTILYGVFILVVLWRWRVQHGEMRQPPRWLQIGSIALGISGLFLSGFNHYTLDSAVAVCLLGYLLKSLEILRRRDAIFQIYLGFFLTGVFLLYRFDPLGALTMVLLLAVNLLALQAVTSDGFFSLKYAVKQTSFVILAAIPVMIAGYLFFPRLPPLWTIPNEERGAKTGMTDQLTPGSVADLARSEEPAFRVSFNGEIPSRQNWYWRGNTMSFFDGTTWKAQYSARSPFSWPKNSQLPTATTDTYQYTVIMEKSGRRWLYFLDWPSSIQAEGALILPDGRAAKLQPMNTPYRYTAVSSNAVRWSDQQRAISQSLQLPNSGNEMLRNWALEQRKSYASDQAFVDSLAQYIRDSDFYYTLKPPLYQGNDSLEAFWFGERRGFCAHYASATAFILRSAGIPARLVGGYLGGVYVASGNYIQVRQMEAHVWLEVWLDDQWQRFDPTAAVAPERVELNLDDLLRQFQPSELPVFSRISGMSLFNKASLYWDSLEYRWQVLVLNYDNRTALGWFQALFGKVTGLKLAAVFLGLLIVVAFFIALITGMITLPKRPKEPYRSLHKIERWYGQRSVNETLANYFNRIGATYPNHTALERLALYFQGYFYQPETQLNVMRLKKLMRELKQQRR